MNQQTESADVDSLHIPDEYRAWPIRKDRYSIWSLLVVMTLLAVWLAVPRRISVGQWPDFLLLMFVMVHQLALWVIVAYVLWVVSSKRRFVLYALATLIFVLWAPIVGMICEQELLGSDYIRAWLYRSGLHYLLGPFYNAIFEAFGYGPD